jgi:hypothetical protein
VGGLSAPKNVHECTFFGALSVKFQTIVHLKSHSTPTLYPSDLHL